MLALLVPINPPMEHSPPAMCLIDECHRFPEHHLLGLWRDLDVGRKLDEGMAQQFAGRGIPSGPFDVLFVAFGD